MSKIFKYERRANYHETDQMGVIHHSNYLKYMEEARVFFMDSIGYGYKRMEELGVMSPVIGINLEYKKSVLFDDVVSVNLKIEEYNGIKLTISYEIVNVKTNEICVIATSKHCFIKDNNICSLKRSLPDFHNAFDAYYKEKENEA